MSPRHFALGSFCRLVALAVGRVTVTVAIIIACCALTCFVAYNTDEEFSHDKISFLMIL